MTASERLKPSILGYALLSLLARGDQSGYDLAQGLKDPVAFFWHAQHSQIYPELARLEALEMVEHTRVQQSERPDKKVFSLTPRGRESLCAWLESPMDVPKKRDELALRAYSIWLTDPQAGAALMREHARAHAANRAEFERRLEKLDQKYGAQIWQLDSPQFGVHAVLRRGIGYEREYLEWCEWMAECLEKAKP